jgi:predicted O-methyltransferase YrrM
MEMDETRLDDTASMGEPQMESSSKTISLATACKLIASQFDYDATDFKNLTNEDPHKGYPDFPAGSVFAEEGKILYAITRYMSAQKIVEIGTWAGVSALHFAAALEHTGGRLTSIDIWKREGEVIPANLRQYTQFLRAYGDKYLASFTDSLDIVFEDSEHTYENTLKHVRAAKKALRPGGMLIVHDVFVETDGIGKAIQKALHKAGIDFLGVLIKPSNCGLALWKKPE